MKKTENKNLKLNQKNERKRPINQVGFDQKWIEKNEELEKKNKSN